MPTNNPPFSEFSYTITETDPDEYNMRLARLTLKHNNKTVITQLFNSTQEAHTAAQYWISGYDYATVTYPKT